MKKKTVSKTCKKCNKQQHARKKACECGYIFYVNVKKKNKRKRQRILDFNELKKGDQILVAQKSGPYYLSSSGEKIKMGYKGRFIVMRVIKNGIVAYSPNIGFAFIYTGPEKFCKDTLIHRRPHRIYKNAKIN